MDQQRLIYLFDRYQTDQLTAQEEIEWLSVLTDPENKEAICELAESIFDREDLLKYPMDDVRAKEVLAGILLHPQMNRPKIKVLWKRLAGIAAVIACVACGIYFFKLDHKLATGGSRYAYDMTPGKNGATLTLANGRKIKLSDAANGEIAREAGISIYKTPDGQVVYEIKESSGQAGKTNVLSTAMGETYVLTLPDHSKVWMNAASSLTYNTGLESDGIRRVKLDGEAYFEISKDKAHPFVVESAGQEIKVLGTKFNVSSYTDEPVTTTTLLEGSVAVSALAGMKQTLKPGEKSTLSRAGNISVAAADVDDAVAWKEGYFFFDNENLESIMRKVSRWYDVDVVFEDDKLKVLTFVGTVSKYKNVSQVLKKLELTNTLEFRIEQKKIIISART